MEFAWPVWAVSVAAVVVSGALAWREGLWRSHATLRMGFVNHGGMWGDLVLLPMANAAIAPHLSIGWWIAGAVAAAALASIGVHRLWYGAPRPERSGTARDGGASAMRGDRDGEQEGIELPGPRGDHMWPERRHGTWAADLSMAGWAHVAYVIGELTLLVGFVLHPAPPEVVLFVAAIFTVHVPLGLLQPRWYATGHIATVTEQPLLLPCLLALWIVTGMKLE